MKDLRILEDRDMKDIVIVDNSIISFAYNMDNGVPINEFIRGMDKDEELLFMVTYLEEIFSFEDMRTHIRNTFQLGKYMEDLK